MKIVLVFISLLTSTLNSCFAKESYPIVKGSFTKRHLEQLKNETRSLFDHGWGSYMKYGYPSDEVRPLSCEKYDRVPDVLEINRNDVLGNYSVTFIDSLTTFAIMGDVDNFSKYIEEVRNINFQSDAVVQVFETTIRTLGSLLSCHLYATDEFKLPNYDGFLLEKSKLLGDKLLSAYKGKNGLPLPRINLNGQQNLPSSIISETCTAGAASPMLELTLLSFLTNDTRYEEHSKATFLQLWNSRSNLDLLPMTLNPVKGVWMDHITGIGASIDSFYEYALKGSILFDDDDLGSIWEKSYRSLSTHSKLEWFFPNVDIGSGMIVSPWIDSLSAFFPGLLVLSGNLNDAIKAHLPFVKLWNQYGGIPERWDFFSSKRSSFSTGNIDPISLEWYPLRPEFIESTYYLYRATSDPLYLRVGEQLLKQYKDVFKVKCGFSGYHDVRTKERQDRMETFVLSETLMYLYLLFDESNTLNSRENFVFSTEGHPLWIPRNILTGYNDHKFKISQKVREKRTSRQSSELESLTRMKKIGDIIDDFKNWNKDELRFVLDYLQNFFNNDSNISEPIMEDILPPVLIDEEELLYEDIFEPTESDVCEVYQPRHVFLSNLLLDPSIFNLDSKYNDQWNYTNEDSIELEPSFYKIYAAECGFCNREPSTSLIDSIIGNTSLIRDSSNIEYFNHNEKKDLWVHSVDGLRLKLELLKPDSIDSENFLVQKDFVINYQKYIDNELDGICLSEDENLNDGVLKVISINGIAVNNDTTVYLSETTSIEFMNKNSISFTWNGHLILHKLVVINMKSANSINI